MKNLSRDLKEVNPDATCFSETNLLYMKNFYLLYQPYMTITPQVGEQFTQQVVEQGENATENATVKLNRTQEKIMAILHVDKYATYDVIAKQLGVERTTVWRNIKKLQEKGRIRRIGGDNGGHWEVIE